MREVLNQISDGIIIINKDKIMKFCNDVILKELGFSNSDIEGENISVLLENFEYIKHEILNSNNKNIIIELRSNKNENIKYKIKSIINTIENENDLVIILNKCEKYTKEDLEKYLKNTSFMIIIKDVNGNYNFVNSASEKLFGNTENIIKDMDKLLFSEEIYNRNRKEDDDVIRTGKVKTYRKYLKTINGYSKLVEVVKTPVFNEKGEVKSIIKQIQDVTLSTNLQAEISNNYSNLSDLDKLVVSDFENSYKKLNKIQNNLTNLLGADGIELYLYDKNDKSLVSQFKVGTCELVINNANRISINENEYEKIVNGIDEGELKCSTTIIKENNNFYHCYYSIIFNDELLGIINAAYYNEINASLVNRHEVKRVCDQIGMIIKSNELCLQLQKQLIEKNIAEKELELFLDTAMDLMCIIDKNDKVIKINNQIDNIIGYKIDNNSKVDWKELIHPKDLKSTIEFIKNSRSNTNSINTLVNRILFNNGEYCWVEWRVRYLEDREALMITGRNINHIKELEKENLQYQKALKLENIKGEFFANLSHEFKTPLNIIISTMQLVGNAIRNNEIVFESNLDLIRYKKSIVQNSYRLLRLINNFIDLTKIDEGYFKLNLNNYNIISLIEDITMSVVEYTSNKGITLIFDTDSEEEIIACDPEKIERIMLNLLSNSIKYSEGNGEINVNIYSGTEFITVSVKDNGIGIPLEKQKIIFQRYVQVSDTFTKKCEGSGIGLALVKSLVNLHGGEIYVKSELGHGSEFIFTIPVKTVRDTSEVLNSKLESKIEQCNIEFSDIYTL